MSKRKDRQRRLNLFNRGNKKCPICFMTFSREQVISGKLVTLEHAPPETLGGKVVCLTCASCNNSASRIDHLAKIAEKARDDHVSGRGTRVEVDFFGAGIVSGYVRPRDGETAAKFAKQPVPTSINQLRGGVLTLPSLPINSSLDVNKGIRFRIRRPNPHKVAVSWLRSAYLLLFALLGREGYRYATSDALRPIREQIMNPDVVRIWGCLGGEMTGVDFPVDPVIMLNHAHEPSFWVVKMGTKCVFLPCGGTISHFEKLTQGLVELTVDCEEAAFWAPAAFRNECVLSFGLQTQPEFNDIDFVGGRMEVQTQQGYVWEWIIVDCQSHDIIALPFRNKETAQKNMGSGVTIMLGENEYKGRKDRQGFVAASPKTLLSVKVDRKRREDK